MLRRTVTRANKAPQTPGPMMQGWGRTAQKRRLEYETVESKYGGREYNKNWDLVGLQTRTTAHTAVRTYFNYPQRMLGFVFNATAWNAVPLCASAVPIILGFKWIGHIDHEVKHAAWW
jgi:hypothetical protein